MEAHPPLPSPLRRVFYLSSGGGQHSEREVLPRANPRAVAGVRQTVPFLCVVKVQQIVSAFWRVPCAVAGPANSLIGWGVPSAVAGVANF